MFYLTDKITQNWSYSMFVMKSLFLTDLSYEIYRIVVHILIYHMLRLCIFQRIVFD